MVSHLNISEIDCNEVHAQLIEHMEHDLSADLRRRIDEHLANCGHCTAVYDGTRNIVQLFGSHGYIELPRGFSQRLFLKLTASQKA